MKEKNLSYLCQINENDKREIISDGLNKIIENVFILLKSLERLSDESTVRGYRILENIIEEECSKYLILIDYLRIINNDENYRSKLIKYFYNHFTRLLYAEYCSIRPATYREVKEYIEKRRDSLYTDGYFGVEYIFRNDLLQKREQQMYVDLVEIEGENKWIGPDFYDQTSSYDYMISSSIIKLVLCMNECYFSDKNSLDIINNTWKKYEIKEDTHWKEIEYKNKETIDSIKENFEIEKENCCSYIKKNWLFPLYQLDLSMKKINRKDLVERRENYNPDI
ncbi:MAG: hypothetical protein SVO01_06920 [Thermotogota bacterium]|nr:hypothetical protein [Thermotogota bacterium]